MKKINEKQFREILSKKANNENCDILLLSYQLPLLLVFLRHLGCAFCHRTLLDLKMQQEDIQFEGAEIVLIHMATIENSKEVFDLYNLNDTIHICDVDQELYRAFGLLRGKIENIFSPKIWLGDAEDEARSDDELNPSLGDPLQMPGVFLLYKGNILRSFHHKSIEDRPIYSELAKFPMTEIKTIAT